MTRGQLHAAYRSQLEASLRPPWAGDLDPQGTQAMLAASEILGTAAIGEDETGNDPGSWIWSDLHLGDRLAPASFGRPFDDVDAMDEALLEAWRTTVQPEGTTIVAGDVTTERGARQVNLCSRTAAAGGYHTMLVYGNHDHDGNGHIVTDGFDEAFLALLLEGDPVLAITHVPLEQVPAGVVNVHGHTHHRDAGGEGAHINVSVEQLDYRPARLADVRVLARHLAAGAVPGGTTTAEQITWARKEPRAGRPQEARGAR